MSLLKLVAVPVVIAICFLCLVHCTLFLPGHNCPTDRPIVQDFNVTRYAGHWYELYRKNDSYEYLGDCNQIVYAPHDNGTIGIKEFRVLKDPRREELDESFAVFTDPTQLPLEGRWNISYKWNDPYFENHRILDTDYETYSITFLCLSAGPDYITDEFVIYTRQPIVSEELETKLTDQVSKYYNLSLLFKPSHINCGIQENLV